ncbi:MAG: exonuclease SbcCD subunit D C-terminal domain-containing protein [Candidatus Riflebacteria bacterium]|nr:exonuclease SbcCD subunit D C-terminal domain-containing protein [Candidatus Riflebacteria bacterium]
MKFIHTADWHLGATLREESRSAEHCAFLRWLLETLKSEEADALIVAGDIFDSANPSAESLKILCEFLRSAANQMPILQTFLMGGNHDSANRIEAPRELFSLANTKVVGAWPWTEQGKWREKDLILPIKDKNGSICAWLGAVPFLRPGDLFLENPKDNAENWLVESIRERYSQVAREIKKLRTPDQAMILTGHLYAAGTTLSPDSERYVQRGNIEAVSTEVFPKEAAYVALGHLHLAQEVGKLQHIRYCGSPIPMSVNERNYPCQVVAVEIEKDHFTNIKPIRVPIIREILLLPGNEPADKSIVINKLREFPDKKNCNSPRDSWPLVEIRVLLDSPDPFLKNEIENVAKNKALVIIRIESSYRNAVNEKQLPLDLDKISPMEMFTMKWKKDFQADPDEALLKAFREVLQEVQHKGEA